MTDQSGAVIPKAKVELYNQLTRVSRSEGAGPDGSYFFGDIVSGEYSIMVEAAGFKKYIRSDINLTSSQTIQVDAAMQLGNVAQEVLVTGTTPIETQAPPYSLP